MNTISDVSHVSSIPDRSDSPTLPNMGVKLQEAAVRYEISIIEQELNALDSKDLEKRIQIWANLVLYRSKLLSLSVSAPRTEDAISPRRLRDLTAKRPQFKSTVLSRIMTRLQALLRLPPRI